MPSFCVMPKSRLLCRGLASCVLVMCIALAGCYQKVEMKKTGDAFGGAKQSEIEQVKGYLKKAGIEGEVGGLSGDDNEWIVEVNPPRQEGKRQLPTMGMPYHVNKTTGEVTKESL